MTVALTITDAVATIVLDDGKANALSPATQAEIHAALDQADSADDAIAVVLAGRAGLFCGGFDLKVIQAGGADAAAMLRGGFELAHRLLSSPKPVVIACTGHAVAMGAFLLLAGDYTIGAEGAFKIVLNETAIGMTMPYAGITLAQHRLTPAAFQRAVLLSEVFDPQSATAAGFLDRTVPSDEVVSAAQAFAATTSALDAQAHRGSKLRMRKATLDAIAEQTRAEFGDWTR